MPATSGAAVHFSGRPRRPAGRSRRKLRQIAFPAINPYTGPFNPGGDPHDAAQRSSAKSLVLATAVPAEIPNFGGGCLWRPVAGPRRPRRRQRRDQDRPDRLRRPRQRGGRQRHERRQGRAPGGHGRLFADRLKDSRPAAEEGYIPSRWPSTTTTASSASTPTRS